MRSYFSRLYIVIVIFVLKSTLKDEKAQYLSDIECIVYTVFVD